MKTWKVFSLAGLVLTSLCVWSGPVQAQYFGRQIDQREAAQERRIHQGIQSGAITPREAEKLAAQQQHIQTAEARMRADGRLNQQERARLDRMLDKSNRNIFHQQHDNQVAYAGHRNQHRQHPGPQFAQRHHGPSPKVACRPNPRERGNFSRMPNRERRFSWNRY